MVATFIESGGYLNYNLIKEKIKKLYTDFPRRLFYAYCAKYS